MAAGLTDHIWTIKELLMTVVAPDRITTEQGHDPAVHSASPAASSALRRRSSTHAVACAGGGRYRRSRGAGPGDLSVHPALVSTAYSGPRPIVLRAQQVS